MKDLVFNKFINELKSKGDFTEVTYDEEGVQHLYFIHNIAKCLEQNDAKAVKREVWHQLTKEGKIKLLNDGFFPYMGIMEELFFNLPRKARDILKQYGFFYVEGVSYGNGHIGKRLLNDDIDDSVWQELSSEARLSLLAEGIIPKSGIRKIEWEALSTNAQELLINNGFYSVNVPEDFLKKHTKEACE